MATVTWIGKQSLHTDPNDATDPVNWVSGAFPQDGDTIVLPAGSLGNGVTLDLIGQPGTLANGANNTIQIAGPFDTLTLTDVAFTGDTVTAGDGASPGQGAVINLTDSLIDSTSVTLGNNAVLNLSGSTATSMQNTGNAEIRQAGNGESLSINATGTVSNDGQIWVMPGGHATLNIAQLGTAGGFFGLTGALINNGGTLTVNGDANSSTRFSNDGFMLIYGGHGAALDQLNARMNGINGVINLLGSTSGATLDDKTNLPGAQLINFGDANGVMKVEASTVLPSYANVGTITTTVLQNDFARVSGFRPGDTIQLVGVNPSGLTYTYGSDLNYGPDVLTINRGTTEVARLRFQAAELVSGTGTIDGAATGNFKLVSAGSDTLVTLGNSQNVVNGGTTIAVTGSIAAWGGVTNGVTNGATTDWSAANWTGGTGAAGIPGQYQTAQMSLTSAGADAAVAGNFTKYVLTVSTAETVGSVVFGDPFARLLVTAPLMLSALPGQGGGGFAGNDGRVEIGAGGTLTTTRLYSGASSDFSIDPTGVVAISGVQSFTYGAGLVGLDVEGSGNIYGGTLTSGGNLVIGQNASASLTVSTSVISQSNTATTYGTIPSHLTTTYTQIGGSLLSGAQNSASNLQIAGPNTTYTDAGGDPSTTMSGGLLVGGGNLSVNALGTVSFPSGGSGNVNVMDGATLTEASFAMVGATFGSSGSVFLNNNAHWNIGLGAVTPTPSIVAGNTITGTGTIWTGNLAWLTVGGSGVGTVYDNASIIQLGTGELFNTAKMLIGGGSNASATGNVTIQGNGATLDTGGGPLIVGQRSSGTLTVGNGGSVIVGSASAITDIGFGLAIGNRSGTVGAAAGVVNLQPGGNLTDNGDLVIGRDSNGTLSIGSGASAQVSGAVYLGGLQTLNNGTVAVTPTLIKGAASGFLNISGGGSLVDTGGTLDLWQGSTVSLSNSQLVLGASDPFPGELVLGFGGFVQGAGLIVVNSNDSTLRNNGTVLAGGLTSNGTLSQAGATLEINAVLSGRGVYALSPSSTLQLDNGNTGFVNLDFGVGNLGTAPSAAERLRLVSPVSFNGSISNFFGLGPNDNRVDLVNAGFVSGSLHYTANADPTTGGTIAVGTMLGSGTLSLAVTGYHPGGFAATLDGAGTGTDIFANDAAPCFAQGTRILTLAGERAVETLCVGDLVPVADGRRLRRIVWIGSTRIDLGRHAEPNKVAPVRIAQGAFAPGMPHRDLVVSPDHAVWTGGSMIPAYLLANGTTIRREATTGSVTYWHIELDGHDLMLAEGLAAESYLDTGNRALFAGNQGDRRLHPDLLADMSARRWDERACQPLTLGGPALAEARAQLAVRAANLGYTFVDDPAITVRAGGQMLECVADGPDRIVALVPPGTRQVVLASRVAVPQEVNPLHDDRRSLGVAIVAIRFAGLALALDGCTGLRPEEDAHGRVLRWTEGRAVISLPDRAVTDCLEIDLVPGMLRYPVAPAERLAVAAIVG